MGVGRRVGFLETWFHQFELIVTCRDVACFLMTLNRTFLPTSHFK